MEGVLRLSKEIEWIKWMDGWIYKQIYKKRSMIRLGSKDNADQKVLSFDTWKLRNRKVSDDVTQYRFKAQNQDQCQRVGDRVSQLKGKKQMHSSYVFCSIQALTGLDVAHHIGESDLYSVHRFRDPQRCIRAMVIQCMIDSCNTWFIDYSCKIMIL